MSRRNIKRGRSLILLLFIGALLAAGAYWAGSQLVGNGATPGDMGKKDGGEQAQLPRPLPPQDKPGEAEVKGLKIMIEDTILSPNSDEKVRLFTLFADRKEEELSPSRARFELSDPRIGSITEEGVLKVSPQAKTGEILTIRAFHAGVTGEVKVLIRASLEETISIDEKGKAYVTNLDDPVIVVNKERNLPRDYAPKDLIKVDVPFSFAGESPKKKLRKEAATALKGLFQAAKADGIDLAGVSGYRSYEMQSAIFQDKVKRMGLEAAERISAHPGQSEHQTGLSIDVSSKSVGYRLVENFGETKEGKWLREHAPEFGFIIRYPKDKERITGYQYEPWHIRYVGEQVAKVISEQGLVLEEFFTTKVFSSNTSS